MRKWALAGWLAALLVDCGGDDDGALSSSDVADLCQRFCVACEADGPVCRSDCEDGWSNSCISGDALFPYVDCIEEIGCFPDDVEVCSQRIAPTAAHESWAESCRDRLAECGSSETEISARCDLADKVLYSSEWADQASACFEEDCDAIVACLDASTDGC